MTTSLRSVLICKFDSTAESKIKSRVHLTYAMVSNQKEFPRGILGFRESGPQIGGLELYRTINILADFCEVIPIIV